MVRSTINAVARFVHGLRRPSKRTNLRLLHERGETPESFLIREVTESDLPALVALHVKTWSDTYWTTLNPPTYEIRERQWRERFQSMDGSWFCFVVQDRGGQLVGFSEGRRYSSDDLPGYSGELRKIYLLRDYQRLGLGRRLVGEVARRFLSRGISTMVLFGTPQNPSYFSISLAVKDITASRSFYEKLGFEAFAGDASQNWLILKNGDHAIGLFQGMFEKNILTFNHPHR